MRETPEKGELSSQEEDLSKGGELVWGRSVCESLDFFTRLMNGEITVGRGDGAEGQKKDGLQGYSEGQRQGDCSHR